MFGSREGFGTRGAFDKEGSGTRGKWNSGIGSDSFVGGDTNSGVASEVKTAIGATTTSSTTSLGAVARQAPPSIFGSGKGFGRFSGGAGFGSGKDLGSVATISASGGRDGGVEIASLPKLGSGIAGSETIPTVTLSKVAISNKSNGASHANASKRSAPSSVSMRGSTVSGSGDGGAAGDEVERGTHLDEARVKVGVVESMCPEVERRRRVDGNDLHILEQMHPKLFMTDPGADTPRQMAEDDLVIKRHMRAAAGTDISQAELLRTPQWLSRTVDHLVANCLNKGPQGGGDPADAWDDPRVQQYMAAKKGQQPHMVEDETSSALYNFVWDRFRMIRSDYNMQGFNAVVGLVSEACIVAHERMARWYILMANRMDRNPSATQRFNLKSIVETLKRLCEFYAIRVARGEVVDGLASPNEPEITAYYLLTVLEQDSGAEVQRCVKDLHRGHRHQVLQSPEVQDALRVVRAWRAGDFVAFFRALRQQRITHRCLLAQYVATMRHKTIQVIAAAFLEISLAEVARLLCFESAEETMQFVTAYGLLVDARKRVHFRAKVNGVYRKLLRRPATIPAIPAPQEIIEPKPWALASDIVAKGDLEAVAGKSHEVNPLPLPVVSGDKVQSPVAEVPAVVETDSSASSPSVTPVFSRGISSSPQPSAFTPVGASSSAGVPAAVKTPGRRGASSGKNDLDPGAKPAVPTKPAPAVGPPSPPSPVRQQVVAPTMTLPPAAAFSPPAVVPVPRAPFVTSERGAQNTVVRAVPQQGASASDSPRGPEFISVTTSSIGEVEAVPVSETKKVLPADLVSTKASAAAARPATTPRVKTARQIWEAEVFSLRLLKAGKIVPSYVMDQLPVDGYVLRSALDGRKRLGSVLMKLGAAMDRRRRCSAWSVLVGKRRCWAEQLSPKRLRNSNGEGIFMGVPARVAAAAAVGIRRVASIKQVKPKPRKPRPLDLLTAVASGLAKSQGSDMEQAFWSVGLTTVLGRGQRGDGPRQVLLSPPHMFWKAVVVAPSRSRGHVGGWLEAKFGGGNQGDSGYLRELSSEGAGPALQGGESMVLEGNEEISCGSSTTAKLIYRSVRKVQMESPPRRGKERSEPQWVHLCVQRVRFNASFPLQPSPELSQTMRAASVIIFAATPLDQDRFFCSPLYPKPDWSKAREDLRRALRCGSARDTPDADSGLWGIPVLVVIPVKDSILKRWDQRGNSSQGSSRESVLGDAAEGLGLRDVAEMGFSIRGMVVGLHEFESRSMAGAAAGEGLVFAGEVEKACSENLAAGLAELAGQAPKQPLMATRSLQGMFETAITRATTEDRYADAVGLQRPAEEPTLGAVVEAATRAASHVCRLVERRVGAWPMPEFAVAVNLGGQSSNIDGERRAGFAYVPGAARPLGVEMSRSNFLDSERVSVGGDAAAALRCKIEASGGLPLDWASWQSWGSRRYNAAAAVAEAACLPDVPGDILKVFSPGALAGRANVRALGAEGAWARVEQLERYLGRSLESEDLRHRLAEALSSGAAMRGAPPAWRTIVRDALLRRVGSAGGCNGSPMVVHFVVASGEDRLARRSDVVPGLMEAEDFQAPMAAPASSGLVASGQSQGAVVSRALAVLKSVAPMMADAPVCRKRINASPGGGGGRTPRRRRLPYGTKDDAFDVSDKEVDQDSRPLKESVAAMSREAEAIRASLEHETSSAAADLALDEAFFASIGISLSGSGGSCSEVLKVPFDRARLLTSLPLDSTGSSEAMVVATTGQESGTGGDATQALGRYSEIGVDIQQAIEKSKREEEEIRRRIFIGDPLLPLDANG